ncbi:uncharacterized protein PG998_008915 [Apiospora kogelbergensis]|uniref:uncharacterized protein n=1 Tax=Apiospora kogelbergensis TaxID=1337665 RepID=UPI00312E245E
MRVITPYRANVNKLEEALKALSHQPLNSIDANTTVSFQSREADVITFVLTVVDATGPLFTDNIRITCVGITSDIGALFAVGNISTAPRDEDLRVLNKATDVKGDDGEEMTVKQNLRRLFAVLR